MSAFHAVIPSPLPWACRCGDGSPTDPTQKQDLRDLVSKHSDVFSLLPGRTTVVHHDIVTKPGRKVRQKLYCIPEAQWEAIGEEVRKMLDLNSIEESNSAWPSPIFQSPSLMAV